MSGSSLWPFQPDTDGSASMSAPTVASPPLPLRNCYWVVPGLLLAGEHPNGPTRDKTKERLKKLLAAGIECFVDLTKPTELLRYDTHLPFYVEYTRKAIRDHGLPGTPAQMTEILDYISTSLRAGRPVYVHCRAGIGRTGTVVGCLLAQRGLQGDAALDELNRLWQQCRRSKSWAYVPETDAQAAYVREWTPTLGTEGSGLSPTGTAKAIVVPMSTSWTGRHGALSVADVQARAASEATGAGQARAALKSLATGKLRGDPGGSGAGLSAAADQARAAVTSRGEISPSIRAEIADAFEARVPSAKADTFQATSPPAKVDTAATASTAMHRTAAPNSGEEAEWSQPGATANGRGAATGNGASSPRARADDPGALAGTLTPQPSFKARAPTAPVTPGAPPLPSVGSTLETTPAPAESAGDSDPLFAPDTLAAARGLRERFLGTMFGLAVGDAVAAATQYRRPGTFSPVGDMIGGGPFDLPRGAWSDDTAMALCLAESLLERDGFDARDQVQRYSRWQQEGYLSSTGQCIGITANTARSLALAKWRRVVFPGSHDPAQQDPEPLSRVAPIALFYIASLETTLVQAADASRTTSQAPAVLDACRRLGRALNVALSGQPKTKILAEVGAITEPAAQSSDTATTALAAALWAFSSTDNFRDAVLRAANVGGNSDVVASVCGQLAGAHYGASAIPQAWRNGLMQQDLIEGYADRLLAHGLVSLSG
jgi:ADP-ribosyl-[dinitrogen reductase] hydrolase